MPHSEAQTTHVTVRELRRIVRAVLPHLSKDPTIPLLTDVEVSFADHSLTLAATDRFTLAAARAELSILTAPMSWTNTVSGRHLANVAAVLPRTKAGASQLVALTASDTHLTVKLPDAKGANEGLAWSLPVTNRAFVNWRRLVDQALAADGTADQVFLHPEMFARWSHLCDGTEPIQIIATAPGSPTVLLTRGAIGLHMPQRSPRLGELSRALAAPWKTLAAA